MRKLIKIFIFIMIFIFIVVVRHYSINTNTITPSSIEKYQKEDLSDNVLFFRSIETDKLVGKKLEYNYKIDTIEEVFDLLTAKSNTLPLGYKPSISPSTKLLSYEEELGKLTLNLSVEFNNSYSTSNAIEELYVNYYLLGFRKLSIEVNGTNVTNNVVTEKIMSNIIYDEIAVTDVKAVFLIKENSSDELIPEIHIVNNNIGIVDYLYNQYKEYISVIDIIEDKVTVTTFNEEDNYLISLVINSNLNN